MPDYELDDAYELKSPEDNRAHYAAWSETYDGAFAEGWGYVAPREIARIYRQEMRDGDAPLLDLGAGTGLVAEHLGGLEADALDITPQMLAKAAPKGLYRRLIEADAMKPLEMADGAYGGVISCGTFTHGHVGPAALPELLRVTRPGGLFVCGVIPPVYDGQGFGSALALLNADGVVGPLSFRRIAIYEGAEHPHAGDVGLVMVFRKAG
ncbi:MAG: class I SAM-dependent methyltransferase [Pseudomonadota bacterium]